MVNCHKNYQLLFELMIVFYVLVVSTDFFYLKRYTRSVFILNTSWLFRIKRFLHCNKVLCI